MYHLNVQKYLKKTNICHDRGLFILKHMYDYKKQNFWLTLLKLNMQSSSQSIYAKTVGHSNLSFLNQKSAVDD